MFENAFLFVDYWLGLLRDLSLYLKILVMKTEKIVLNAHKTRLRLGAYWNLPLDGSMFYLLPTIGYSKVKRFDPEDGGFILEGFQTLSFYWLQLQLTIYLNDPK
jgi:hypothetical protein